jgi:general secretion pathway protein G
MIAAVRPARVRAGRPGGRGAGFTLIELVIAVAIVGVLAMMAAPMLEVTAQRQREAELRTALRQIRTAIDAYHELAAAKPPRIETQADGNGYPPDLAVLVDGVRDNTRPDMPPIRLLRRLPRDPMNPDQTLSAEQTWGKRSYASPPDEPKEGDDVFDIYSRSAAVGLNGVPYRDW